MRNRSFSWHPKAANSLVSHFQKICVLKQMKQICLWKVVSERNDNLCFHGHNSQRHEECLQNLVLGRVS